MADWPSWLTFRPIVMWPREETKNRQLSPFRAPFSSTVTLLGRELRELGASGRIVLEVALDESQLRLDGLPRANQRAKHPGVILAFESKHGPLKYATDRYVTWEENLRAIALSLEKLRAVDRYGVSTRGEQYTGWKQLGAGPTMSQQEAAEFIVHLAGWDESAINARAVLVDADVRRTALRLASKKAHPDTGGSVDLWNKLAQAKALLPV